eukprot:evm.model.scf_523.1 EVM.evm.TU.scf_523.1   scf_523:16647-23842(-)
MPVISWKPLPFLKGCLIEYSANGQAICKSTGKKLVKGEPRFVCKNGSNKVYLSLDAAAKLLRPIIASVQQSFQVSQFEGLDLLAQPDREAVFRSFDACSEGDVGMGATTPGPSEPSEDIGFGSARKRQKLVDQGTMEGILTVSGNGKPTQPQLTDFEKQRMAQIERNRQVLSSLKTPFMEAILKPQPRPTPKRKSLTKPLPPPPSRRSLRQQGKSPYGSSARDADIENVAPDTGSTPEQDSTRPRHQPGDIDFKCLEEQPKSDASFLRLLSSGSTGSVGPEGPEAAMEPKGHKVTVGELTLREEDVVKVTPTAVVLLGFQDRGDELVVAGGDKTGHVGLWHLRSGRGGQRGLAQQDNTMEGTDDDSDLLTFAPHSQMLSGLKWAGGRGQASCLFTASYDGSVRRLDAGAGRWLLSYSSAESEYSAFECSTDGQTGYLADKDGFLEIVDMRTGSVAQSCRLHGKKVNALEVDPAGKGLLVSASTDATVSVWDVRALGSTPEALATLRHLKSCHGARFCPSGASKVVTTSFDDTLAIWDFGTDARVSIRHNNNTGRWLSPFKALWDWCGDNVLVGGMMRTVDMYDSAGKPSGQLSSEHMSAIPCRMCTHPQHPVLATATGSGRIHVFQRQQ